jgi:hypothetical protein
MAWTPNKDREIKNGKAVVSAAELAEFRKTAGESATLRDLLNADKGLERRGESRVVPQVKAASRNEIMPDTVRNLAQSSGVKMSDARDLESGMSRGSRPKQGASTTEEGMKDYKPRRTSSENTETSDMSYNKKGGAIKMASGGSASRRADGIAMRGKTRGKLC